MLCPTREGNQTSQMDPLRDSERGRATDATEGSTLTLPDGRRIGYAEYGPVNGEPILFFPGTPGSRFRHPPEQRADQRADRRSHQRPVRVFVLERPGFGLSDHQVARRLLDWPSDVQEVSVRLGLERFYAVGVSGGGPYALACAYRLPSRIKGVTIVSSVGPPDIPAGLSGMPRVRRVAAWLGRHAPRLLEFVLEHRGNPQRDPEGFYRQMLAGNAPGDRAYLARPDVKAEMMRNYVEATRQGVKGLAQEGVILSQPWGYSLQDIAVPVSLWHGEADQNVSLPAARYMARAIPHCRAHFVPGKGHSLLWERWDEIVTELLTG